MFLPSCKIDLDEYFIYEFEQSDIEEEDGDCFIYADDEENSLSITTYRGDSDKYTTVQFNRKDLITSFRIAKRRMFKLLFVREHR